MKDEYLFKNTKIRTHITCKAAILVLFTWSSSRKGEDVTVVRELQCHLIAIIVDIASTCDLENANQEATDEINRRNSTPSIPVLGPATSLPAPSTSLLDPPTISSASSAPVLEPETPLAASPVPLLEPATPSIAFSTPVLEPATPSPASPAERKLLGALKTFHY